MRGSVRAGGRDPQRLRGCGKVRGSLGGGKGIAALCVETGSESLEPDFVVVEAPCSYPQALKFPTRDRSALSKYSYD